MGWGYCRCLRAHGAEQGCGPVCPPATPPLCHTLRPFLPHSLFSHQQGMILEKLRICSMPQFVRFVHDLVPLKEDPDVVVTDLLFGTVPVKLYQPKGLSCTPRPGIVFYHGGGAVMGSLSKNPSLRRPPVVGQPRNQGWGVPTFHQEATLPSPSWRR